MRILADASLPGLEIAFPKPFFLSLYSNEAELPYLLPQQDILFCRSTLKVTEELLKRHHLRYVATASSGTDHVDHLFLRSQGITLVDAKGSNASSVADYVIACLAYLDHQQRVKGKRVGIIGMGEVGKEVHFRLKEIDFQVECYDPLRAQSDLRFKSCPLENLFSVDILCVHAELHNQLPFPSRDLLDSHFLSQLKSGCIIINAARGGIVNEEALLHTPRPVIYCTDVYLNEPSIDNRIVDKAILCTPHIAGHSIEAKWGAVTMISKKLHQLTGLPLPKVIPLPPPPNRVLSQSHSWQEFALSVYNPIEETLQLKQAKNKEAAFLKWRKKHQKRHDFSVF